MRRLNTKPNDDIGSPFGGGLFAKLFDMQKNLYINKVNAPIIPLEDLAMGLIAITDQQWNQYAFSRDPINGILTDEEREQFGELSLACADEYVQKYQATGGPERIAEQLNVRVSYPERPSVNAMEANRVLFARYSTPGEIEVFTDCTNLAEEAFSTDSMQKILGKVNIKDVLLCHELFHHLEELDAKTIYTENARKERKIFRIIPNPTRIACLGEIAAMRFAKGILNLPYSPYIFDVLLAYLYDKQVACNLYAKIQQMFGLNVAIGLEAAGKDE